MATTGQRRIGLARLVTVDGHTHWAEPELHVAFDGSVTLAVPCDFGGVVLTHYVARDRTGAACWQTTPFVFPGVADAEAARDELAAQQPEG